ncbi:hypothetical protein GYH30_006459 [Glycine max]|nr:hypothetical protein GYH30_006459 [Glycine max]
MPSEAVKKARTWVMKGRSPSLRVAQWQRNWIGNMQNRSGFGARSGSSVILVDYFDSLVKLPATVVQKAEKYTLAIVAW